MVSIVPVMWIGAGAYGQFNTGHANGGRSRWVVEYRSCERGQEQMGNIVPVV